RCAGCGLQYAGQRGLAGLAAGLPWGRGRYVRMLAEVPRFHGAARRLLDHGGPGGQTLADFLRTGGFSRYFTAHFALPLVAAVWSCPSGTALRYPARYLFAFLANHGMLSVPRRQLVSALTAATCGWSTSTTCPGSRGWPGSAPVTTSVTRGPASGPTSKPSWPRAASTWAGAG